MQDLRAPHALHLASIGYGVEDITTEVVYAISPMRRALLRRKLGRGVRDLKAEMRASKRPDARVRTRLVRP